MKKQTQYDTWLPSNTSELCQLLRGHYSRRHEKPRRGRIGGIGEPAHLATLSGSAFVATWQRRSHWQIPWRTWPSWWNNAFRRHPDDPAHASELITAATIELQRRHPGPVFTAIDPRHVKSATPGLVFLRAGYRYHCCTRPFQPSRRRLILVKYA